MMLQRVLRRPPELPPDDRVLRAVRGALHREDPDPLFRRRLRGVVLNQYIARRDAPAPPRRREMGKLGRAVLYASVALALSLTVGGAVSQDSRPGDLLYTLKRRIEEIRVRVAPESVQGLVLGMALDERLSELQSLAVGGDWSRVEWAAEEVAAADDLLVRTGHEPAPAEAASIGDHVRVVRTLVDDAPTSVQQTVVPVLEGASQHAGERP
jgi:hypothetical protein